MPESYLSQSFSSRPNWCWLARQREHGRPRTYAVFDAQYWLQAFPFWQFHVLFNSLFKVLFIFPSRYLFAIGLSPLFSFRWYLPPILGCIPKQPDSLKVYHMEVKTRPKTGLSPSTMPCSKGLMPGLPPKILLETTIRPRNLEDFKFELFPLHSPLLGESLLVSFPPLIDMLKFSGYSCLIWDQSIKTRDESKVKSSLFKRTV